MAWTYNGGDWSLVLKQNMHKMMQELAYAVNEREKLIGRGDTDTVGSPWNDISWPYNDVKVEPFITWANKDHGIYLSHDIDSDDYLKPDPSRQSFPTGDYFSYALICPILNNNHATHTATRGTSDGREVATVGEFIGDFQEGVRIICCGGSVIVSSLPFMNSPGAAPTLMGYYGNRTVPPYQTPERPYPVNSGHSAVRATWSEKEEDPTIPVGTKLITPYRSLCGIKGKDIPETGQFYNLDRDDKEYYPNFDETPTHYIYHPTYSYFGNFGDDRYDVVSWKDPVEVFECTEHTVINAHLSQNNMCYYFRKMLEAYKYAMYFPASLPSTTSAPGVQVDSMQIMIKDIQELEGTTGDGHTNTEPFLPELQALWSDSLPGATIEERPVWIDEERQIANPDIAASTFGYTIGLPLNPFATDNTPRLHTHLESHASALSGSYYSNAVNFYLKMEYDMELGSYVKGDVIGKFWTDRSFYDEDGVLVPDSYYTNRNLGYDHFTYDPYLEIGENIINIPASNALEFVSNIHNIDMSGLNFPAAGEPVGFRVVTGIPTLNDSLPFIFPASQVWQDLFATIVAKRQVTIVTGPAFALPRGIRPPASFAHRNPRIVTDLTSELTYG